MVSKSQTIEGFDEEGGWDPTISLTEDGNVTIEFPEFPPQNIADEGLGDTYDDHLSQELGVEIYWEDREFFWILEPDDPEAVYEKVVEFFEKQVEETESP